MKQRINIDYIDGTTINGHVILKEYKTGNVEIKINTYVVVKGIIKPEIINLKEHNLGVVQVNSQYVQIPFTVDLEVNDYDTYHGKHITFNYTVEAEISVPRKRKRKRAKQYVKVERTYDYAAVEKDYDVPDILPSDNTKNRGFLYYILFFGIPLSCMFFEYIFYILYLPFFLRIGLKIYQAIIMYKNINKINMKFNIKHDPNGLVTNFTYDKSLFKITEFGYRVFEELVDTRGTVSTSKVHELYKSESAQNTDSYTLSYPNLSGLKSIGTQRSFIKWVIFGKGTFLENSKEVIFEQEIEVGGDNVRDLTITKHIH